MRILSGIQPSGILHVGNYFGMMRPSIELQDQGEAYYFIADYHSMTSLYDADLRRDYTRRVAVDFLACGLNPERAVLFKQSDVPEHVELSWILSSVCPMGLLERCHSYKDKIANGVSASHGLFAYPVLMAADILIYDADSVPVGSDQKQHVEVTRDLAQKFNQTYGETFKLPEPRFRDGAETVLGLDGQKMSKSYNNAVEIFGEEKATRKRLMSIVMDSRTPDEPKPDAEKNLAIQLIKHIAPTEIYQDEVEKLKAGGYGYGNLKKRLFELYWEYFRDARARRDELMNNLDYVDQVLANGAAKAREIARPVNQRARRACGLD